MLASKLNKRVTLYTERSLPELRQSMQAQVEPVEGELGLVHKISPGGIVLQVLRAPVTARPFFGRVNQDSVRIAMVRRSEGLSPYQPILSGTLRAQGQGCVLEGTLALHPGVRSWSLLYVLVGLVLVAGGATRLGQPGLLGGGLMAMGLLFAVFPQLRAWQGFEMACTQTKDALEQHLGLQGRSSS